MDRASSCKLACMVLGLVVAFASIHASKGYALAGNRKMVENNVKELDNLNRKMVSTIPDLPANAVVDIKADVKYSGGEPQFRIYEKNIRETREETFDFGSPVSESKAMSGMASQNHDSSNVTDRRKNAVH